MPFSLKLRNVMGKERKNGKLEILSVGHDKIIPTIN